MHHQITENFDQTEDGIDLRQIISLIWRHKWKLLSISICATLGAYIIGLQITPQYTASALVMIESRENYVIDLEKVATGITVDTGAMETQVELLRSHSLAAAVIDDRQLTQDAEFGGRPRDDSRPLDGVRGYLTRLSDDMPRTFAVLIGLQSDPAEASEPLESTEDQAAGDAVVEAFQNRLQVRQRGRSQVLSVAFTSSDPAKAALLANAVAERYVEQQRTAKLAATLEASSWLGERLTALRDRLEKSEQAVAKYRSEAHLANSNGVTLNDQQITELSSELVRVKAELAEKRARLQIVSSLDPAGEGLENIGEAISSREMQELREEDARISREEAKLGSVFGERHPRMLLIKAEKEKLHVKLGRELARIKNNLANEVRIFQTRQQFLQARLDETSDLASKSRHAEIKLKELERIADADRRLYETFLERFRETEEQQDLIEANAAIISRAKAPDQPSSPAPELFAAVGFVSGSLLSVLIALLADRLDRTVRSESDLEGYFGADKIIIVPHLLRAHVAAGVVRDLADRPASEFAESMQTILAGIYFSETAERSPILMVTSSLADEGKTTVAAATAVSAQQSGLSTILVDLDLRRPRVHEAVKIDPQAGVLEYLLGEASLDDVIHVDDESGLSMVPIKRRPKQPANFVRAQRLQEMLAALRCCYDLIIIDTAPVLPVSDSRLLAKSVDGVIFVTRWQVSPLGCVGKAQKLLDLTSDQRLVVTMNDVNLKRYASYGYMSNSYYYKSYQKYYQG